MINILLIVILSIFFPVSASGLELHVPNIPFMAPAVRPCASIRSLFYKLKPYKTGMLGTVTDLVGYTSLLVTLFACEETARDDNVLVYISHITKYDRDRKPITIIDELESPKRLRITYRDRITLFKSIDEALRSRFVKSLKNRSDRGDDYFIQPLSLVKPWQYQGLYDLNGILVVDRDNQYQRAEKLFREQ